MHSRAATAGFTLLLLALLTACPGPGDPTSARDLVAVMPADVDLVTFVDLASLRDHPLWSRLEGDPFIQSGEPFLEQLKEWTGLDPRTDLNMVLFVARGLGTPDFRIAMFVRGELKRARLEALSQELDLVPQENSDVDCYTLRDPITGSAMGVDMAPGLEDACVAFIDDFTLGFGSPELLAGPQAVRRGTTPSLLDSEEMGLLVQEGLGSGQFWGVFRSVGLAEQLRSRIEDGIPLMGVLKGFSGIEVLRFTLRFSSSIDLVARTRTGTEEEAQLLADTLNGFLALAKLMAKDEPDVLRFLDGTLVGLDVDSVRLSMNIDAEVLERIQEGLFQRLGG
jgi:hypothetical protein